jgi:hypothetical protein
MVCLKFSDFFLKIFQIRDFLLTGPTPDYLNSRFQICWTLTWDGHWHWDRWNTIPMTTVNSALACHALTMLALCYLPGTLAAYIQIIRGTKFSRFPNWLDNWLKMRKQIGLLMLLSATIHVRNYFHYFNILMVFHQ